jgi:hypothetical protein
VGKNPAAGVGKLSWPLKEIHLQLLSYLSIKTVVQEYCHRVSEKGHLTHRATTPYANMVAHLAVALTCTGAFEATNSADSPMNLSCGALCQSAWNDSNTAERISTNFDIWDFCWRMAKYLSSVSNQEIRKNEENFEWRTTLVASPNSSLPSWESEILYNNNITANGLSSGGSGYNACT